MHYWRESSFKKLDTLQERLAEHSDLAHYVEYLNLLDRGLRREALQHIEQLIAHLKKLDVAEQRRMVSILCWETEGSSGHKLMPHPLKTGFVEPVIKDWIGNDPSAVEPLRWTGELDDLIRAVELDPACDYTRRRLVMRILSDVSFSTHELPAGYLGDVEADEDLLILAGREARKLIDDEMRTKCLNLIREEHEEIHAYKRARNIR